MVFDVDHKNAHFLPEDRGLPEPTYFSLNPRNGHGHLAYLLAAPVSLYQNSRSKPILLYEAVRRGFTRRLVADWNYSGKLTKNPFHPDWPTMWITSMPFRLDEMNDVLTKDDKRWDRVDAEKASIGRNCELFEKLRHTAYRKVIPIKRAGGTRDDLSDFLIAEARDVNAGFTVPLFNAELRATVKSITNWTWENYTISKFSAIQAARSRKRWAGHKALSSTKPWEQDGVSRSAWFSRRKALLSDMG